MTGQRPAYRLIRLIRRLSVENRAKITDCTNLELSAWNRIRTRHKREGRTPHLQGDKSAESGPIDIRINKESAAT